MRESRLAHQPARNNASRHAHLYLLRLQLRGLRLPKLRHDRRWRMRPAKLVRKRRVPQRLNLFQFFLSLLELVARLKLQDKFLSKNVAREYSGPHCPGATMPARREILALLCACAIPAHLLTLTTN